MTARSQIRIAFACFALIGCATACVAQGGAWMSRPQLLDADGSVFDLLVYEGELIAAGDFEHIGGVAAGGLAAFDGQRWRALADPLRLPEDGENTLNAWAEVLVEFDGNLIVGGRFTLVGEELVPFVARWDGETLEALGSGANRRVASLTVHQNALILGGYFTQVAGVPAERVARFKTSYEAMDNGFAAGVTALASFQGRLWAGGLFSQSGNRSTPRIAYWADGAWLGSDPGFDTNDDDPPAVFGFSVIEDQFYALGHFHQFGSARTNGLARWDGTTWVGFAGGLGGNGQIFWGNDMLRFAGELYVCGRFVRAGGELARNVARYDGERWWPMGLGTNNEVKAMAEFQGELYVGGIFTTAGNDPAQHLAVWKSAQTPPARHDVGLQIFPNPARGSATFRVELPGPAIVEFRLTDLRGRLLRKWNVDVTATTVELPLELERAPVANGRYLLTMRSGDTEITRSFVYQR